jgi:xanthine dehydrogenase molybdenum-binding subunit
MKVLERAAGHATGPFHVPAVDVEAIAVRTNNPIAGAFRGFGANQAHFAMDGVLDRLGEKVGISGFEIRRRNVVTPGAVWGPGQIMDDGCLGAGRCLAAVKPAYDEAVAAGKAVGVALGLKNSGLGNGFKEVAKAVVRFEDDGSVEVRHCWTEMGQGVHMVALKSRSKSSESTEPGHGQGRHHPRARSRPDDGSRATLMRVGPAACEAAELHGRRPGVDYFGSTASIGPTRSTTSTGVSRIRSSTRPSATRRSW